jgi:hypothetical protein
MQRIVKPSYNANLREQAEKEYKSKLTLEYNKAKEAYDLAESDAKVYGSRPDMTNMNCWLSHLKTLEDKMKTKKVAYEAKSAELINFHKLPQFYSFVQTYCNENFHPTEDDYETVKMANQYGIVEED